MTSMLKMGLLTLGVAMTLHSTESSAAVTSQYAYSNAVNFCQAFTPGVTNTIRNRVIGSENVGTAPIAVACNFQSFDNGDVSNTPIDAFFVFVSNSGASDVSVSCTMLAGDSLGVTGTSYTVSKTAVITAGSSAQLLWGAGDNPTPGSTDLGNVAVGVNCVLPPHVSLGLTGQRWTTNNGV